MTLFSSSRQSVAQNAWSKGLTKRFGDVAITIPLIALTLPLMALVAFAIKCDSRGPVLIREEGVDTRGRRFTALKFRSSAYGHELDDSAVPRAKICLCPTPIGRYLRYTRIENLPLLFSVLRGEMSCIEASFLD